MLRRTIVLLSAIGLLVAGCAGSTTGPTATTATATQASTAGEPYTIGAIFDITGGGSSLGAPERDTVIGLEAQVNAQGGIKGPDGKLHPLRVVMYDNQSQESQTVLVAKRLIQEDKVSVIIGSSQSGTTLAMLDTVQQAQVPLISAAANAGIVQPVSDRKWVFKTPQNDELIMSALLDWLKSKSVTKVAWISVNNAFGDGGRTQFDKLSSNYGVSAVANERFGAADPDMTAQLTKIKGTDAQAIIVWAVPPAASTVTRNAVDLGIKLPIFQSHGIGNQDFITLAGPAAEGVTFPVGKLLVASSLADSDAQKSVLMNYSDWYQKAYGKLPTTFGGHAWDAFWLAEKALEKAGPNPSAIRDQLEQIKEFVGITGVFNLSPQDHNGLDKRAVTLVRISGGKWTPAK